MLEDVQLSRPWLEPSFLSSHIATSQLPTETVPRAGRTAGSASRFFAGSRRLLSCSLPSFARLKSLVMSGKVLLANSMAGRQRNRAQERWAGPLFTRGCCYLSGAGGTSQRAAPHRWELRKLTWSQGGHRLLIPGMSLHYSGQPAQHNVCGTCFFLLFSLVPLALPQPPPPPSYN